MDGSERELFDRCICLHVMNVDYELHLYGKPGTSSSSSSSSTSLQTPCQNSTRKRVIDYEYIYLLLYNNQQQQQQQPYKEKENEKQVSATKFGLLCRRQRSYDEKYLEHLRQLGFEIPSIMVHESSLSSFSASASSSGHIIVRPFWGHHHDACVERLLNSKVTSARLAKEKGWGFHKDHSTFVRTYEDVVTHVQKYHKVDRWLLRRPLYSAGIGQKMFFASTFTRDMLAKYLKCDDSDNDENDDHALVLLEPFYTRVVDIGTTFVIDSNGDILRQFLVENYIAESGGFIGGTAAATYEVFKMYIERKYRFYDLDALMEMTKEIVKCYIEMGARGNVQIDSFVYKYIEDGVSDNLVMRIYPLVEVNYRKTMGLVIQRLADMHTSNDSFQYVEWKLIPKKQLDRMNANNSSKLIWDKSQYTLNYHEGEDNDSNSNSHDPSSNGECEWKQLSPSDNLMHSFFRVRTMAADLQ